MPNKTPSYKDKVIEDFSNHFGLNGLHAKPLEYMDYEPVIDEVKDFISQALTNQMKLVMECLPMNMETDPKKYSGYYDCLKETRENFKEKGLI